MALVSDRSRRIAFCLLVAVVAVACASPNSAGVSVESVQADIVFGVKEPLEPVTPANVGGKGSGEGGLGEDVFVGEELAFEPTNRPGSRPPLFGNVKKPANPCPPAAANAFPDREATLNVHPPKTLPPEGVYRWKREGQQTDPNGTSDITGFEERLVQNVEVQAESETRLRYTFQTLQPSVTSGAVTVTDWYVDSNPAADQDVNSPVSGDRVTAGEPERGVVIRGFDVLNRKGDNIGSVNFAAGGGLLVVPLPIRSGERFASAAIDTRSGQSYRIEGSVIKRTQIDACGTVIAGWQIETRFAFPGGSATYNYVVAPQFGGLLLQEVIDQTAATEDGQEVKTKATFTIGQQNPDPLPKEEE